MAKVYRSGKLRGKKVLYPDGVGYTIWQVLGDDDEDDGVGICFDFPDDQMNDMLRVLRQLEDADADVYEPDPEYEEFKKKQEETEKKWWKKLHNVVEDIGIQFTPFDWRFHRFLVSKKIPLGSEYGHQICRGFYFGPFCITW
jgi:hypothetical protein